MRSRSLPSVVAPLVTVVLAAVALPAQGVVNSTLLRAAAGEASSPLRTAGPAGVVAKVRGSVVWVAVEVDGPRGKFVIERASSGVIVDGSGLVVTFAHLVAEAQGAADKRVTVQLDDADNTKLAATIVAIDAGSALALLRVSPPAAGLRAAELGPERPAVGEAVVVLARPEGKEMLAFGGVASSAIVGVRLRGVPHPADGLFLTDARNDERCDGGGVFDAAGRLLGFYASEHVQRDMPEPTLADLLRPSFAVCLPAARLRAAFRSHFDKAGNASLRVAPAAVELPAVAAVGDAVVSVWAGGGAWPVAGELDPGGFVRRPGLGSGVVLTASGLVVANAHVAKVGDIRVRGRDGKELPATLVKAHGATNLALLQVQLPAGASLPAAATNADEDAIVGEAVLAVGNPYGTALVVSGGVVSAVREREGGRIQADANLGNQNGGGAVVDRNGRLLGIVDAGVIDPIEAQFRVRGDRATTETNLSTFVGIGRVRRVFGDALAAAAAAAASEAAWIEQRRGPLARMVERHAGAMLNIYVARSITKVDADDPFASMQEREFATVSLGSGVIIDRSGLALSNWHVVDDATRPDGSMVADHRVTARVYGGKEYPVRVLSISREDDLSLLQLELAAGEEVAAVELGSSDHLAIGEWVAAIGNPHGRANTVTFGIVTAKDQELRVRGRWAKLEHLLETDAAINGGNSGGALLDMDGRLVGINSAGGGTFNNRGYAIAVDHVRKQVTSLLFAAYKLRSPDLGMRLIDDGGAVLVMDVDPRGPAAAAGVASGDKVVAFDGVPITWSPGFALQLLAKTPGAAVPLVLARDGKERTVVVAPVAAANWAVLRQSGLAVRDLGYAEDGERIRQTAIALVRGFTKDPTREPQQIPTGVVMVERVFPGEQKDGTDIAAGDLILAVELHDDSGNPELRRIDDTGALRDLWNDFKLGTYEGQSWRCWVARGTAVRPVELVGKRLFW